MSCLYIFFFYHILAMDMPSELTALNITPQGALLRWNPPLSSVDNYVLTLTHNQGKLAASHLLKTKIILIVCSLISAIAEMNNEQFC